MNEEDLSPLDNIDTFQLLKLIEKDSNCFSVDRIETKFYLYLLLFFHSPLESKRLLSSFNGSLYGTFYEHDWTWKFQF